ncbi:MAG: DNA polymerase III subunit delta [Parachlamydiaceae bacterium]|nr:MAG: DNA polymerase III subunit delta [Parachlamydiaceae bacterium]
MKYNQLKAFEKHLEGASPAHFAPVYMILSKDEFNRKIAYEKLIKHLLGEQIANPMALSVYNEEKADIAKILQELDTLGIFAAKRVVVIHQADNLLKPATEKLLTYYENPNPSVYLVLTASSIAANTNFYKKSELVGVILEIPEEKSWEKEKSLKEWVDQKAAACGKQIESAAIQLLLKQIGTDQALLNQEIEKLVCYVGDRSKVTSQDVSAICISVNTENVWQLGEAIFQRDPTAALRIALALIKEGIPLLMLLRQIRTQFQTDFQVCTLLAQGGSGSEITKQFGYMKGQILEKHMHLAKNFGLQRFRKGLILIDETELAAKNSAAENAYLIERLIVKLVQ